MTALALLAGAPGAQGWVLSAGPLHCSGWEPTGCSLDAAGCPVGGLCEGPLAGLGDTSVGCSASVSPADPAAGPDAGCTVEP